jgi:hypothetical protein
VVLDAEKVLKTVRQASMLSRAASGRRGMVVSIPVEVQDVLVAGDLHGNVANLIAIMKLADLDRQPGRHLVLQEFVHGARRDAEGGCTSHRLLDAVCSLKVQYPQRVHLLLGNHELSQWTGRKVAKDGVYLNDLFELGVVHAYGDRADEVLEAYDGLFASMLLGVRSASRVFFSHSIPEHRRQGSFDVSVLDRLGVGEDDLGPGSSVYQILWGRDSSAEAAEGFCRMVDADFLVTGHIAQPTGYLIANDRQIIVDCVDAPAACVLVSNQGRLTFEEFSAGLRML